MTRNLKALGLALVAVFAMSAVLASAAQAAEEFFHWDPGEKNPHSVVLTGEADPTAPNQVFEPVPGTTKIVTCKTVKLEGTEGTAAQTTAEEKETTEGKKSTEAPYPDNPFTHTGKLGTTMTSKTATVTPTYGGAGGPGTKCDFAGAEGNAEVKTNECHYQFTANTNADGHGGVHVICPEGKTIDVTVNGVATLHIGTQTPAGGVHYTNIGTETSSKHVTAEATAKEIKFTCTPKAACTSAGLPTEGSTATYTGKATLKGYEDLKETSTGTYEEGKQVGIWKGITE